MRPEFNSQPNKTSLITKLNSLITFLLLLALVAYITIFTFVNPNMNPFATKQETTITVIGEGSVQAEADMAIIRTTIQTTSKDSVENTKSLVEKLQILKNELKKLNVIEENIKSSNTQTIPKYQTPTTENGSINNLNPENITEYTTTQEITIEVNDIQQVSSVITTLNELKTISMNVQFDIKNTDQFENQARELALKNAHIKADKLSKSLNLKLGEILNIKEIQSKANYYSQNFNKTVKSSIAITYYVSRQTK